jgi:hypothetical protein
MIATLSFFPPRGCASIHGKRVFSPWYFGICHAGFGDTGGAATVHRVDILVPCRGARVWGVGQFVT